MLPTCAEAFASNGNLRRYLLAVQTLNCVPEYACSRLGFSDAATLRQHIRTQAKSGDPKRRFDAVRTANDLADAYKHQRITKSAANRQHAAVARTSVTASTPGTSPSGSTPHAGSVAKIKIEFVDGSGTTRTTEEMSDFLNRAKACWLDIFKKAGVTVNSDHTVS